MMKLNKMIAVFSVFVLGILIGDVHSAESIKQRMIKRLPVVKDLKTRGIVGENNIGFLEFIGDQKEKADVVKAENRDRKLVYDDIAKKQGTTAEVVGKHRAAQIAARARAGELLQDGNGKWYEKK